MPDVDLSTQHTGLYKLLTDLSAQTADAFR
jgi:hypothetical protein